MEVRGIRQVAVQVLMAQVVPQAGAAIEVAAAVVAVGLLLGQHQLQVEVRAALVGHFTQTRQLVQVEAAQAVLRMRQVR